MLLLDSPHVFSFLLEILDNSCLSLDFWFVLSLEETLFVVGERLSS